MARCAKRAVAADVQEVGAAETVTLVAAEANALVAIQLDCFVVPPSGTPRNDRI